jgi:hypothetical protein
MSTEPEVAAGMSMQMAGTVFLPGIDKAAFGSQQLPCRTEWYRYLIGGMLRVLEQPSFKQ